ncbi:putative phage abortive infection protein [Acinetobacter sp.]|uniref:putative phage abortive infection protein n=1 Tax=Acinetobacter sp. TaxID=472 RepID=UPI000C09F170|nr:putative phage abortive infection protein [Acinetobacter sp.]MAK30342.1 hypothetical protein [Acinetobacter sp.]
MNNFIKYSCLYIPVFLILLCIFGSFFITSNQTFHVGESLIIDKELSAQFGNLYGGLIGTLLSASSVFLLIYTIIHQKNEVQKNVLENHFFRMIDYHNQHLNHICIPHLKPENGLVEGKRAFIQFKIQFKRILDTTEIVLKKNSVPFSKKDLADISYIIFYYGIEGSWTDFIYKKFEKYNFINLSMINEIQGELVKRGDGKFVRANQTYLSAYFRNMYNLIKMVDESNFLDQKEKENLIKIYRAQFSNAELYIIFFNVISRFGRKWINNQYIEKYELLKNIPFEYCDGYNPKDFFNITYEEEED